MDSTEDDEDLQGMKWKVKYGYHALIVVYDVRRRMRQLLLLCLRRSHDVLHSMAMRNGAALLAKKN